LNTNKLEIISEELGDILISKGLSFTSAESCTGGWIGQSVTAIPGSSKWYGAGFITYSNIAKANILDVSKATLKSKGAVSEEVVTEMVEGALIKSGADVGVAVSGIAGPGGGSKDRPIGTVCIGWKVKNLKTVSATELFSGNRNEVRYATVEYTLKRLIELVRDF
jgi:nicotinamide-nucleotide amidase